MLLNYRGVAFEDVRYEFGNFPKEKFKFGRLPGLLRFESWKVCSECRFLVLEIDGKQLPESGQVDANERKQKRCQLIIQFTAQFSCIWLDSMISAAKPISMRPR